MIDEIPEEFEVYDVMHEQRQEVVSMIFTEFDAKRHDNIVYEDGLARGMIVGRSEGLEEGMTEGLSAMIHTLRVFISDPEEMYKAVISNKSYADVPHETVKNLFEKE